MCGVVGAINFTGEPIPFSLLKQMTDEVAHRGPDGEGQWTENNVGLGHRRLAIIDLSSSAHQPMLSDGQRYVLSYNGEVYNYRELRKELQAKGVWFHSESDTEVVLNSLIYWGADAFIKFNGMFALALWDRKKRKMYLARDRYGIKPLYYSIQNQRFRFGSEQKSILIDKDFKHQINKEGLLEYFTFQNFFTDQTLSRDIKLLPAGHYMSIDADNGKTEFNQYWDFDFREPDHAISKEEYVSELDRLFYQAVDRQLVSDVEVGAYLSGGMDSGSITAIASKKIPNLKSFTVGFDLSSAAGIELGFDEREIAEALSGQYKTEHYEMVLKAGDMERCLASLVYHLEEPRTGQSYPNYYAAKLASKFVKVVLSGTGGDELFGGYPWRYYSAAGNSNFENYIDNYYSYWQRLLPNSRLKKLFGPMYSDVQHIWTRDIFKSVFTSHPNNLKSTEDYINQSLYFESKTFLQGLFLVEDKLSMAHGLENRVPFMDNDLVNFAMQCPVKLKLNNIKNTLKIDENEQGNKKRSFFKKTNDGKQILRKMMSNYIPIEVTNAQKKGFSSPDASWFKGESMELVRNKIFDKNSPLFEYLDYAETTSIISEHFSGTKNHRLLLWSLLSVHQWLETNNFD